MQNCNKVIARIFLVRIGGRFNTSTGAYILDIDAFDRCQSLNTCIHETKGIFVDFNVI